MESIWNDKFIRSSVIFVGAMILITLATMGTNQNALALVGGLILSFASVFITFIGIHLAMARRASSARILVPFGLMKFAILGAGLWYCLVLRRFDVVSFSIGLGLFVGFVAIFWGAGTFFKFGRNAH